MQILRHRQLGVEGKLLRHIAQLLSRLRGALLEAVAHYPGLTRAGLEQSALHLEGGGFARTVGAQQAENFTALHTEAHLIGCREVAKAFGQLMRLDHGGVLLPGMSMQIGHQVGEYGIPAWPTTQQADEGILQSRLSRAISRRVAGL